jgi:hypothetical protein
VLKTPGEVRRRESDLSETGGLCSSESRPQRLPQPQRYRAKKRRGIVGLNKQVEEGNGSLREVIRTTIPISHPHDHSNGHPQTGALMIRFLLRFIGLCLLATAFVFLVYDGTKSIANHDLVYTKVGDVWAIIDQNSLNLVQEWLKQKFAFAWDPYLQRSFDLPAWAVVGIVATILILLGRKKRPLIGYARD